MEASARRVIVSGEVQGVGFRYFTKVRARELGLAGWVQNLPDGRVEVWVEGPDPSVQALVRWLRSGPPSARVQGLEEQRVEPAALERFDVRR